MNAVKQYDGNQGLSHQPQLSSFAINSERPDRGPHPPASTTENPNKTTGDMSVCTNFSTWTLTFSSGSTILQQRDVLCAPALAR